MKIALFLVALGTWSFHLQAALTLHPLFGEGAVLQREQPVPVWGTAEPGVVVTVNFAGQSVQAMADPKGAWRAELAPMPASAENRELRVASGNESLTVKDVVVGDIWLASGQSNMDSPMSSGRTAAMLGESKDPLLRFFVVKKNVAAEPQAFPQGKWSSAAADDARSCSAVGFLFAREIRESQGVPVGILQAAWGGTPIKTWMSAASLEGPPPADRIFNEWKEALAKSQSAAGGEAALLAYYQDRKDWEENVDKPFRAARKEWQAAADAARAAGEPVPPQPQHERPKPESPDPLAMPAPGTSDRPSAPTGCFNGMIAPLAPFAMRGALWYQGEADASRGLEYRDLLQRLITGWRKKWGQGDFPFLVVQLPGHGKNDEAVATKGIAWLREAQDMAQVLPAVHVAVTSDIGDAADVHPDNKPETAKRLASLARQVVYGEKIAGLSPRFRTMRLEGSQAVIEFDHAAGGLVIGQAPWVAKNGTPFPEDRLVGFYLAGEDREWFEADAQIKGESVVLSSASVPRPVAVRYAWANTPVANLYNKDGVPAAPFRTDDWPK